MADDNVDRANLVREAVTRLPIFTGDDKDAFTPEQWIARIERVRVTTGWNDEETMSFVYVGLRGIALQWYESFKRSGIANTYAAFRTAFLSSFSRAHTARSCVVTLHDVKQTATDTVVAFYAKVVKIVDDIENILPAAARAPAGLAYINAVSGLQGFDAIPAADRTAGLQANLDLGVAAILNHLAIQIFVAGLRPSIRDKMMENMPVDLWNALQDALRLEKIHAPKVLSSVNEIAEDTEVFQDIDGEIAAIQKRLSGLQYRKTQFQNKGQGGKFQSKSGKPDKSTMICRCCRKTGHNQTVCFTRINKRLPCVDQNGVPYAKQPPFPEKQQKKGGVSEIEAQSGFEPLAGAPPQGFMPSPSQQGYWTPCPPNFP